MKMCEAFQSAAKGAAAVITLAKVSRLLPSARLPRLAKGLVICVSDRLDELISTLFLAAAHALRQQGQG